MKELRFGGITFNVYVISSINIDVTVLQVLLYLGETKTLRSLNKRMLGHRSEAINFIIEKLTRSTIAPYK
jgi:hypothetical protein